VVLAQHDRLGTDILQATPRRLALGAGLDTSLNDDNDHKHAAGFLASGLPDAAGWYRQASDEGAPGQLPRSVLDEPMLVGTQTHREWREFWHLSALRNELSGLSRRPP
jgi:hypothetical protein